MLFATYYKLKQVICIDQKNAYGGYHFVLLKIVLKYNKYKGQFDGIELVLLFVPMLLVA